MSTKNIKPIHKECSCELIQILRVRSLVMRDNIHFHKELKISVSITHTVNQGAEFAVASFLYADLINQSNCKTPWET